MDRFFTSENIQEHGELKGIDMSKILEETRNRKDFDGTTIFANYATDYPPFSWIVSEYNVRGVFKDMIEVIANKLNLTVALKKSTKENLNVWFSK